MRKRSLHFLLFFILGAKHSRACVTILNCNPTEDLAIGNSYTISDLCSDENPSVTVISDHQGEDFDASLHLSYVGPYDLENQDGDLQTEIATAKITENVGVFQSNDAFSLKACGNAFLVTRVVDPVTSESCDGSAMKLHLQCSPDSEGFDIDINGKVGKATISQDEVTLTGTRLTLTNVGDSKLQPMAPLSVPSIRTFIGLTEELAAGDYEQTLKDVERGEAFEIKFSKLPLHNMKSKFGREIEPENKVRMKFDKASIDPRFCKYFDESKHSPYLISFFDPHNQSGDKNTTNNHVFDSIDITCEKNPMNYMRGLGMNSWEVMPSIKDPKSEAIIFGNKAYVYSNGGFTEQSKNLKAIKIMAGMMEIKTKVLSGLDLCPSEKILGEKNLLLLIKLRSFTQSIQDYIQDVQITNKAINALRESMAAMLTILNEIIDVYLSPTTSTVKLREYATRIIALKMKLFHHLKEMHYKKMHMIGILPDYPFPLPGIQHLINSILDMGKKLNSPEMEAYEGMNTNDPKPLTFPDNDPQDGMKSKDKAKSKKTPYHKSKTAYDGQKLENSGFWNGMKPTYLRRHTGWRHLLMDAGICEMELLGITNFIEKLKMISNEEDPSEVGLGLPPNLIEQIKTISTNMEESNQAFKLIKEVYVEAIDEELEIEFKQTMKNFRRLMMEGKEGEAIEAVKSFMRYLRQNVKPNLSETWTGNKTAEEIISLGFDTVAFLENNIDELIPVMKLAHKHIDDILMLSLDKAQRPEDERFCQLGAALYMDAMSGEKKEEVKQMDQTTSPFVEMAMQAKKSTRSAIFSKKNGGIYMTMKNPLIDEFLDEKIAMDYCGPSWDHDDRWNILDNEHMGDLDDNSYDIDKYDGIPDKGKGPNQSNDDESKKKPKKKSNLRQPTQIDKERSVKDTMEDMSTSDNQDIYSRRKRETRRGSSKSREDWSGQNGQESPDNSGKTLEGEEQPQGVDVDSRIGDTIGTGIRQETDNGRRQTENERGSDRSKNEERRQRTKNRRFARRINENRRADETD